MNPTWKYLLDQMEIETANNAKKAVAISQFHDSALKTLSVTYPGLLPLYERYHPLHLTLIDEYSNLDSTGGAKQGDRVSVALLLASSKETLVDEWMVDILKVHKKGSPAFVAILPKGLSPFNDKGIDARIAAYSTLAKNIGTEVALANMKAEIITVHTNLLAARNLQKGAKTTTSNTSDTLDIARIAAMNMQYRNLGNMMDTYFDTKEVLCPLLFDLVTLRIHPQTVFTGNLLATNKKAVMAHTFKAGDTLGVKTTQASKVYLATTIGGIDSIGIAVVGNIKTVLDVVDFGVTDFTNHRFLTIVNEAAITGRFAVTLL